MGTPVRGGCEGPQSRQNPPAHFNRVLGKHPVSLFSGGRGAHRWLPASNYHFLSPLIFNSLCPPQDWTTSDDRIREEYLSTLTYFPTSHGARLYGGLSFDAERNFYLVWRAAWRFLCGYYLYHRGLTRQPWCRQWTGRRLRYGLKPW